MPLGMKDTPPIRQPSRATSIFSNEDGGESLVSNFADGEKFITVVSASQLSSAANYFEIEITNPGISGLVAVGIGSANYPDTALPGWIGGSYGYHADGILFIEQGETPIRGPKCTKGDRMGCGVDFATLREGHVVIWFTKNDRLVCNPEKIIITPKTAFHSLLSVAESGEVTRHYVYQQQSMPALSSIYPWYDIAGFNSVSEIPFYSNDESLLKYGMHKMKDRQEIGEEHSDGHLAWDELRDALWDEIPSEVQTLGKFQPETYQEWIHMAESTFSSTEEYVQLTHSQNGCRLENNDHAALYVAQVVMKALNALNSGFILKEVAILVYLSLGMDSTFLNITVVAGLLYMGCSANSSTKAIHIFHNPDISVSLVNLLLNWGGNPNVPDAIGRTSLHIHQTNRGLMRTFLDNNADVNALDDERNSPLHYAGVNGRAGVAGLLMEKGANASATFGGQPSSLDVTASAGHFDCFKQMLKLSIKKVTEKKVQQQVIEFKWRDAVSELPKWKKVKKKAIEEMSREEFFFVTVRQQDGDDNIKYSLRKLVTVAEENKVDLQADMLSCLFDRCLYGQNMIIADILDADINGNVNPELKDEDEGISLLGYLSKRPTLLMRLVSHDSLKAYISDQWSRKALGVFSLRLLFYLFQLVLLTFALAVAARPDIEDKNINSYSTNIDIARGVCEGFTLMVTCLKIVDEALEMTVYGLRSYLTDLNKFVLWLSMILILVTVPLRFIVHPSQWIIASLAYFMFGMRSYYLASLFNLTGTYIQTLVIIISRDVVKFLAMFCVVLMVFSGTFLLSLRYDVVTSVPPPPTPGGNETASGQAASEDYHSGKHGTSENLAANTFIADIYYTGLRILIESGSILSYYGEESRMGVFSIVLYLLFLFIIVTILLNVLIAQVSDTYAKVLEKAEGIKLFNQCMYIAKLEKQKYIRCLKKCCCCWYGFYRCFCKIHKARNIVHIAGEEISNAWDRPRILITGQETRSPDSIAQVMRKSLNKVMSNYLPDTIGSAKSDSSEDSSAESLEIKVDALNQKLKEMEEHTIIMSRKQEKKFAVLIETVQTSVLTGFNDQRQKIHTDIQLSEDQETLMIKFFQKLEEFRSEAFDHQELLGVQHAQDQASLGERFGEVCSEQKQLRQQVLKEKQELREEMLHLHSQMRGQLDEQDSSARAGLSQQEQRLAAKLQALQAELRVMAEQQEGTKEEFANRHSQLSSEIGRQQQEVSRQLEAHEQQLQQNIYAQREDVRSQLQKHETDVKAGMSDSQDRLLSTMLTQQTDLEKLAKEQQKATKYFTAKHKTLEERISQQQADIHQQVAKQQHEIMSEFPSQWEALSKLITENVSSVVRGEVAQRPPSKKK